MLKNKKLAGILIETKCYDKYTIAIIGVGVNVNMTFSNELSQQKYIWTSIARNNHTIINDRNKLAALIINAIDEYLRIFFQNGSSMDIFKNEWIAKDALYNKKINMFPKIKNGIAKGISDNGELLIYYNNQTVKIISGSPTLSCSHCL